MVATHNYVWEQGEDLVLTFFYKYGSPPEPIDLTTGYSLRMDMRKVNPEGSRVWTFNSDDIPAEPDADEPGEADNEVTLGTDGLIEIVVGRALTLPGGSMHTELQTGVTQFAYDMFLRDPNNRQRKILAGVITLNKSVTLWS